MSTCACSRTGERRRAHGGLWTFPPSRAPVRDRQRDVNYWSQAEDVACGIPPSGPDPGIARRLRNRPRAVAGTPRRRISMRALAHPLILAAITVNTPETTAAATAGGRRFTSAGTEVPSLINVSACRFRSLKAQIPEHPSSATEKTSPQPPSLTPLENATPAAALRRKTAVVQNARSRELKRYPVSAR